MPRSKHSEAAIIAALQQLDAGRKAAEVAREVGASTYTIYAWKAKYGVCTFCCNGMANESTTNESGAFTAKVGYA